MSVTTIDYSDLDPIKRDEMAIDDMKMYLTDEKFEMLLEGLRLERDLYETPEKFIHGVNIGLAFIGIVHAPFHAFCRKYFLQDYRAWMASNVGGPGMETDENGFAIQKK